MVPIRALQRAFGLQLSADQKRLMRLYLDLLKRWQRRINLTGIEDAEEFFRFHFFEAFWAPQHFLADTAAVADVGSGAGFPGLAMKIYCPSLRVTLIEKNYKKVAFLREVSRQLDLPAEIFQGRAEDYGGWEGIDVATIRALRPSKELLHLLSTHGIPLLYFHGSLPEDLRRSLTPLKQARIPESHNRFATLFQCST